MRKEGSGGLRQTVLTLLRWVEKKLGQAVRTDELATVAGYCPRHLGKGFLQVTGMSPARYIRLRKLTQAAHLLRLTRRPVTDIAMMYAFGSLQVFSRAFRRHFGLSPQAYRNAGNCPPGQLLPPPELINYPHTARMYRHTGFWLKPHAQKTIQIEPGMNIAVCDQGNLREGLYKQFYNKLFRHNRLTNFTVLSQTAHQEGYHVQIHTITGTHTGTETPGAVYIPPAQRLCFEFSGPLKDAMVFHHWVNTYGLKQYGVILNGDTTFTTYRRLSPGNEEYAICYCLPVSEPSPHCHARRNREAFPAV
ncbi:transcriptional activator RamA [Citrobacter freundii]|nr:transcriptional activator RamA [Citrobacter freundii]